MSEAIQNALIEVLGVPPDDFFQIHHVLWSAAPGSGAQPAA
jgi:hypothetical protein